MWSEPLGHPRPTSVGERLLPVLSSSLKSPALLPWQPLRCRVYPSALSCSRVCASTSDGGEATCSGEGCQLPAPS